MNLFACRANAIRDAAADWYYVEGSRDRSREANEEPGIARQ
jgi:hypothetical protein